MIRRTYGFKRDSDSISLGQMANGITTKDGRVLDEGTGLSKQGIINGINELLELKIIEVERRRTDNGVNQVNVYRIRRQEASMPPRPGRVVNEVDYPSQRGRLHPGQPDRPPVVNEVDPQQTVIQETERQEIGKQQQATTSDRNCQQTVKQQQADENVVVALTKRGVHQPTAEQLAQDFPTDHILEKVEVHDWLLEHNPRQLERNPAGWLVKAIEDNYSPPRGFRTKKQRQMEIAEINRQQEEMLAAQEAYRREHDPRGQAKAHYNIDEETMRTWEQALGWLENEMAKETFDNLLQSSLLLSIKDGTATIGVRNSHAKEWLEHRLAKVVQRTLSEALGQPVEVKFTVLGESMEETHFLRKRRNELGLSQEDLARRLKHRGVNLSRHTISDWERGLRRPQLDEAALKALAEALRWDLDQFADAAGLQS